MIPTLDKQKFYEKLKPHAKSCTNILIFMFLDEGFRYQLIFDWTDTLPDGSFNPTATAQLMDMHKIGFHRYIVNDLQIDMRQCPTDYKLYKTLKKWIDEAFSGYDEEGKNDSNKGR